MPDSINNCGLLIAPPHNTTSRRAVTTRQAPSCSNSTPAARFPSKITRVALASVCSVRFGLRSAGLRYASAVLHRAPLRCVTRVSQKPSGASRHSGTAASQAAVELLGLRWGEMTSGPFSMRLKYSSTLA
jgi:hypothetical protein